MFALYDCVCVIDTHAHTHTHTQHTHNTHIFKKINVHSAKVASFESIGVNIEGSLHRNIGYFNNFSLGFEEGRKPSPKSKEKDTIAPLPLPAVMSGGVKMNRAIVPDGEVRVFVRAKASAEVSLGLCVYVCVCVCVCVCLCMYVERLVAYLK